MPRRRCVYCGVFVTPGRVILIRTPDLWPDDSAVGCCEKCHADLQRCLFCEEPIPGETTIRVCEGHTP